MTNFATMRQNVADNVGKDLDGGIFETAVNLAIISAIDQVRSRPLTFNQGSLSITPLVVDQFEYSPGATGSDAPEDLLYLHGQDMWIEDTAASTYSAWPMVAVTNSEYQSRKAMGGARSDTPECFVWVGKSLLIYPAADVTTFKLFGHYVKDLGKPTATQSSGVWTFDADSYTSAWFDMDAGYQIVMQYATAGVLRGYLRTPQDAQPWLDLVQGELAGRVIEEERIRNSGRIAVHF